MLRLARDLITIKVGFSLLLGSYCYADGLVNAPSEDNNYLSVGESIETEPPVLINDIDEEMAVDICKVLYTRTTMLKQEERFAWDEIKTRVYPVYSYDGTRKYYIGLVYRGPGEMPSHDEMMENVKRKYKAHKKIVELEKQGKNIPDDLKQELKIGSYWSTTFSASTSGMLAPVRRNSLPHVFLAQPYALEAVKDKYGVTKPEVDGFICEGYFGGYIRIKANGRVYYAEGQSWHGDVLTGEEMVERAKLGEPYSYSEEAVNKRKERWDDVIGSAEKYKAGEPIEYMNDRD